MRILTTLCATMFWGHAALAGEAANGATFYLTGEDGIAIVGGGAVRLPASRFPCANCHGKDAAGRREGATIAPPLRWAALERATPDRPAYTAETFARAVTLGLDPAGRPLSAAMPRYELKDEGISDLVAFLASPALLRPDGLFPDRIVFAPTGEPAFDRGVADALSERGGSIFGRRLMVSKAESTEFDLGGLRDQFATAYDKALAVTIGARLVRDKVSEVRLVGAANSEMAIHLETNGIGTSADARDVIILGPGPTDGIERAYGDISVVAPHVHELADVLDALFVVHIAGDAERQGLEPERGIEHYLGRAVGLALIDATASLGRDVTPDRLAEALRRIPVKLVVSEVETRPQ